MGNGIALVRVTQHASRRQRAAAASYLKDPKSSHSPKLDMKSDHSPASELHDAAKVLSRITERICCIASPGVSRFLQHLFRRISMSDRGVDMKLNAICTKLDNL